MGIVMFRRVSLFSLVLALSAGAAAHAQKLSCSVSAGDVGMVRTDANVSGAEGSASGSATTYAQLGGSDRVTFEIDQAGVSRVLLPRTMLPPVHTGGDQDGWRPIDGLHVTDDQISGHLPLNFLNAPIFSIDRISGDIMIKSRFYNAEKVYRGSCVPYSDVQRKF